MHRSIELAVPSAAAEVLVRDLRDIDGVVGLSWHRGASLIPAGDQIVVHALNQDADSILKAVERCCAPDSFSVVTAEVASISDAGKQADVDQDVDEAIWEELETGLRHQGRLTANFLLLMAIGGFIAGVGALAEMPVAMAAYVASAIIAPGFEPIAKLPLGMVLWRVNVIYAGLKSALAGYAVLILAAAAAWLVLSQFGVEPAAFLEGEALKETIDPKPTVFAVSIAGAFAGSLILASYRRSVIAGALVAMRLIEAAAVAGVAAALGRFDLFGAAVVRLGIDMIFVIVAGLVVFGLKQALVHRRAPLR